MRLRTTLLMPACLALAGCERSPDAPMAVSLAATQAVCVNDVSGFRWRLRIDATRHTVDGWPAAFAVRRIAWRDGSDGAGYSLDRLTGALTVTRASSTGGVFNVVRCRGGGS